MIVPALRPMLLASLCVATSCAVTFAGVATADPLRVSPAGRRTLAPEVAVDARGAIHVIWLDREPQQNRPPDPDLAKHSHSHLSSMDLWYARSDDGGRSFRAPVRVNGQSGLVWGFAVSKPRVAAGRSGTIHVSYPANEISEVNGKPVLTTHYTRSTDGGASFEAPRRLNTLPDADLSAVIHGGFASAHAFGTMGLAPDGSLHVAWIDTRHMKPTDTAGAIYLARSRDDGRSFEVERAAWPEGACPCCQLTLAFDARSKSYLGSRLLTAQGERLASVARSAEAAGSAGAAVFGERVPIGGAPWKIEGCPLKPTVVAVSGTKVYAASFNGAESPAGVYFAASLDGGVNFARPLALHPEAAVSDAPALAVSGRRVYAAWHAKAGGGERRIFWRTIADSDGRFGALHELASAGAAPSGATPSGAAQSPALAARPDGQVQIVWQQGEEIFTDTLGEQR